MKILINFGPLKVGGGHNVALNFFYELKKLDLKNVEFFFCVPKYSKLTDVVSQSRWKDNVFYVSNNPVVRIVQELTSLKNFLNEHKIQNVYSYFGFALLGKKYKQVVGSADSNLYFPEVDFWKDEPGLKRLKRFLVDKYRIFGLKNAHAVIFENKAMCDRAEWLFSIKNRKLILPSINFSGSSSSYSLGEKVKPRVLLLCGWQRNKNILKLPEVASEFKKNGINIEFVLSVSPDGSSCSNEFLSKINNFQVEEYFKFIGRVNKDDIPSLYSQIDIVYLLSKLESFSNNIIEAWYFNKPLIVADEEWARAICENSAIYVNRDDAYEIMRATREVLGDRELAADKLADGGRILDSYPAIDERVNLELSYLTEVFK